MNIFLDTFSLVKLYHNEPGTDTLDQLFLSHAISAVFLSEVAKIEFSSTVWKKVRNKEISEVQAVTKIALFEAEFGKYSFLQIDNLITDQACDLIKKYGKQGLRTLDSIQLSTAVSLLNKCELFITTDKLLHSLFDQERLPTRFS